MEPQVLSVIALFILAIINADLIGASRNGTLKHDRVAVTSFKRLERRKELKCGRPLDSFDQRIVGGKVASIVEFP